MKSVSSRIQDFSRSNPNSIRIVTIVSIYILVILLAPLIAREFLPAILVVGGFVGIIALIFFVKQPGIGFTLLVVSSLLIPFSISTGTQTKINAAILVLLLLISAWLVKMVIIDRHFELLPSRSIYAAIAFMAVTLLSFGFGQLPWYPAKPASIFAQLGQVLIMLISAGAFIVAAHRMENQKWLKLMVFSFILLGGVYVIGFAIPPLRHYVNRIFQRAVIDSLFWTWLIALSFSQFWSNKALKPVWRALFLIIAFAAIFTVAVTKQSWVSGWLPAFIALFVILFLTRPRIAILSVFVFILVLIVRYQIIQSYLYVGDNEYSMLTRLEAWKILFQIIQKNPVFGLGPANYYFYTPFYKILGYSVSFNSHNNYIDLLAQTGILGLGAFFWWTFEIGKTGIQLLRKSLDEFEYSFVIAALGGLAGTMAAAFLGDWVLPFIYNVGMEGVRSSAIGWVFLGSLIFIHYQKTQRNSSI